MEPLIESIRAAVADSATDEVKKAGADACRAILAALDAHSGEPLAVAPPAASTVASVVSGLRNVPPDQLLDLIIAKLRTLAPDTGAASTRRAALSFQLVPLPKTQG